MYRTYEVVAVELADSKHLMLCSAMLFQQNIPNRVYENNNQLILLVFDEQHVPIAQHLFDSVKAKNIVVPTDVELYPSSFSMHNVLALLLKAKITALLIIISLVVALYTYLGTINLAPFLLLADINGSSAGFNAWRLLPFHEPWRFISPAFLHMGWLHLCFNLLWLWFFGSRIELRIPRLQYICAIVVIIAVSNICQYLAVGGELPFGGLSGLVYGLLGICWWYDRVHNTQVFHIPPMLVVLMLLWLILCALDAVIVDLFHVANTAHITGLLCGMGAAYILSVKRAPIPR